MSYVIASATRNKIVLSLKKEQFIYLKFDSRYSKVNAFNLALLAKAAYLKEPEISEFLFTKTESSDREYNFKGVRNVSSAFLYDTDQSVKKIKDTYKFGESKATNTQFFHFETEEYILFSFRGTQEIVDWATNLNAEMVKFEEGVGIVHAGFYKAFTSIVGIVDEVVLGSKPDKPIIICGHSLGGAISNLVGGYLRKKGHSKVMIYTFGSPLVGDTDFTYHFSKVQPIISYRFVHNQDLVPMVPPPHSHLRIKLLLLGPLYLLPATYDPFGKPFNHFGKLVFVRRIDSDAFSVDVDCKTPTHIRVPNDFPDIVERPWWDTLTKQAHFSINEHFQENYVSILGSDLKFAIRCYMGAKDATIANTQKIMDYLEAELKILRASHAEFEKKLMMPVGGSSYADATSTGPTPPDKLSPSEKLKLLDDAIQAKQMELGMQRSALAITRAPGFAQSIQSEIVDLKMTPTLKSEFEYQKNHISY
jgi:hypothetical protein